MTYAPDVIAEYDPETGMYTIGGDEEFARAEVRARGFVPASSVRFTRDYVQGNAFQVRGLLRRGDAQRFKPAELEALVRQFFADRGVEYEQVEAFCFNYEPNVTVEEARIRAAVDAAFA